MGLIKFHTEKYITTQKGGYEVVTKLDWWMFMANLLHIMTNGEATLRDNWTTGKRKFQGLEK